MLLGLWREEELEVGGHVEVRGAGAGDGLDRVAAPELLLVEHSVLATKERVVGHLHQLE